MDDDPVIRATSVILIIVGSLLFAANLDDYINEKIKLFKADNEGKK